MAVLQAAEEMTKEEAAGLAARAFLIIQLSEEFSGSLMTKATGSG